jgi:hypothetical protein
LADRLAAVEGRLAVSSPSGAGTTIRAELPLVAAGDRTVTVAEAARGSSALAMVRAVPDARAAPRTQLGGRLSNPVVLIAMVLGAIAVVAVLAAVPAMQPRPPVSGRADEFVRPFDYQVPADSDIRLQPKSDHLHVLSAPPGNASGISIWAVEGVLQDHCTFGPAAAVVPRQPGAEGLLTYIRSIERLNVEEVGRLTIDGKPAYRVDLTMNGATAGCENPKSSLFLWRDDKGSSIQVGHSGRVPVMVLDVDGETIAIEIWSGGKIEAWESTAQRVIESIRFLYRPPVESPTAHPSTP